MVPTPDEGGGGVGDEAGVLLVDKAAGHTSHDVVVDARRRLGIRRVGHTGTLDPFATGLLLLCIGRATRLAEYFHLLPKTYEATLRLGVETATHDPEGEVRTRCEAWRDVRRAEVKGALAAHVGRLEQRPPSFSAKRVGGRRAHRLARQGRDPGLGPVPVEVQALEMLAFEPPELRVRARVSTGTYIRALARDIGRELGCGAHLSALRRTAVGPFVVEEAVADPEWESIGPSHAAWRTPAEALEWLPRRDLDEEEARAIVAGRPIAATGIRPPGIPPPGGAELPIVLVRASRLVAVAEARRGSLRPRKVLVSP